MDYRFFNGACYVYRYSRDQISPEQAGTLLSALNVKNIRSWEHIAWLLSEPGTINREEADRFHHLHRAMKAAGVEQITAMSHTWFYPEGFDAGGDPYAVPKRDLSEGSLYRRFLDAYELSWYTLVKEFPEVDSWETGNEQNHDPFLHPPGYHADPEHCRYTLLEKADITTDMMLAAARGVRRANPKAWIVMPGMAPIGEKGLGVVGDHIRVEYDGMRMALERIYQNIKSGEWGTTNPRDFFDALCWHPYYARQNPDGSWTWQVPNDLWVGCNNSVYDVAVRYGDGKVPVYLSEFGFNDFGDPATDESLCRHMEEGVRICKEKMPYVTCLQAYRMFEHLDVPDVLDTYAFFKTDEKGIHPKKRAFALQKAYGGSGSLEVFF